MSSNAAAQPVIEFRTGVRDKLGYAARWLAVASQRGARVRVIGETASLQRLSQQLWLAEKEGFIAHAFTADHAPPTPGLERTPIWLGQGPIQGQEPALLLNVGAAPLGDLVAYERVIEVIGSDPADTQAGRERWAHYKRAGLAPAHRQPQDEAEDAA